MQNNQEGINASKVLLSVELDPALGPVLVSDDPLSLAMQSPLLQRVAEVMKVLGIPGTPVVRITALEKQVSEQFLRISVNHQRCEYPDELLQRVHSYVNSTNLDAEANPHNILVWLVETLNNHEMLVEFLSLTCLEIVKSMPYVLLGQEQVIAYIGSLPNPSIESSLQSHTWPPDPIKLLPILRKVLAQKISIADTQRVAEILRRSIDQPHEEISENLIAALCPDVIELRMRREYLRQVTAIDQKNEQRIFSLLRTVMFQETGLWYPSFRFNSVEDVKPSSFAFKINHLTLLPWIGLAQDQLLIEDTASNMEKLHIQSRAVGIPHSRTSVSLINLDSQKIVLDASLLTRNPMQYLAFCLATTLRENGSCFLNHQVVQRQFEQLKTTFPMLVETVQEKVSIEQITRILRSLVSEQISIKNQKLILGLLLEYTYNIVEYREQLRQNQAQPDDFVKLISFIRSGLKYYIRQKYTSGTNILYIYLLDAKFEDIVSERLLDDVGSKEVIGQYDSILKAIQMEISSLPPSVDPPPIVTTVDIRPSLREIIAPEFPRLPVLSYEEIPLDTEVKLVARISLDD